ncbi:CBS domain-containing protein [Gottschalkia acidurici 9a]|uniref:CBS domain-containing protein n=1 Tax=Gottschalkia acidurici (strain ATCC 7906 / DSM 604 / BCRC 14475 / CIP 104303 / KCTC 5404 / NCIMB 10678 / 9a) TaxID=1128398 RepID=K0B3J4_GOTA9|nr:hemolysin family protein [Gottschalkia acidurici]AFS79186.1 CBS domain-containing protein [Gottschalkia acidurici 9a]
MDVEPRSIIAELLLILILVLINAFFAASEMAMVSINKNKINKLADEGDKKAQLLIKLMSEPSRFLSTVQVGITLAGFLASASAATSVSERLSGVLSNLNIPGSKNISVVIVTIILSYITLVFGELFPKRIALQKSEQIAMFSVKPILFVSKLTLPFVKLLTFSTNLLLKVTGIDLNNLEEKVSEEEIRSMIEVGEENGVINEIEKDMIDGIFEFDDTLAKEIMTPRTNVFALEINTPIREMISKIISEQYSRVPIYEEDTDNIIGVLYMKDLFEYLAKQKIDELKIRNILRSAYFVPETKNIDALFKELQNTKNHMAILIDEYGGFSGIVTIEDLVEEVMGNILDEHDADDEIITKVDNNTYVISGLTSINEVNNALHLSLPSSDFDTIGGFMIDLLGAIPSENEEHIVEYENLTFKIEKVSEKRIEELKLYIN